MNEKVVVEVDKDHAYLTPRQIVDTLGRPGVVGYEVTTTGMMHPRIKKIELEINPVLAMEIKKEEE